MDISLEIAKALGKACVMAKCSKDQMLLIATQTGTRVLDKRPDFPYRFYE